MQKFFFGLLMMMTATSAMSAQLIKYPGLLNGEKVLLRPDGTTTGDPENYCRVVLACTYNYSGCTAVPATDLITASSDKNGVCKALGFSKAVASSTGASTNAFGQFVTLNSDGHVTNITQNKKEATSHRGRSCVDLDPANRSFVYVSRKKEIFTTITCE